VLFMNALLLALSLSSSTASTPVVMPAVTITAKAPAKWTCGAPQALQNDEVQTVRLCSTN
jgi:hypothetical protein